jgi:hypothetical protein
MEISYADAVKKDPEENLEANVINNAQHHTTSTSQDKHSDNYDAAVYGQVNESKKIVEDLKKMSIEREKEQKRTRGTNEVAKKAKKGVIVFTTVALDIALAGLLVGSIYKKPAINRVKLGFGTVGLSLFYGFQWYVFVIT